ncbi:DEAD/DEAH box helicase [Sphingobacterium sp. SRCM116780]|uniref:DEAD/DEAH box helicase n=1 Tax=Sphingobacterium sp. SRCM116780 TaxID=2907623 RepID=UPI001F249F1D|nr:DEAD/DEAH box helicase [Sphingobacterium sp. SRCM116780]UIR57058.1 DEAD/DEAH box helicase [Sphingobacterium sp. SRCM116780]
MEELGYLTAKEIQVKSMSRILGGQDIIAISPEGSGKTTTYVLSVLTNMKFTIADAPKVLILAPDQDRIQAIVDQFYFISKNKELSIIGLRTGGSMEQEIEKLVAGVEIVVATPNRARAVYLKLGLNLNLIHTLIIDDAEDIIKNGMITPVKELAKSCKKCQHLIFSTVEHEKLHQMVDDFMVQPALIEVEVLAEQQLEVHDLFLYRVPNFTTKINLLNHLMRDTEVFDKVVVFVNSRLTAQKLSKSLHHRDKEEILVLNPLFFDDIGIDDCNLFKERPASRILIVANEGTDHLDLTSIPFIFHFELPENKETFLQRIIKTDQEEHFAFTFSTDLELPEVKRIEQIIGQKMQLMELPTDLAIYNAKKEIRSGTMTPSEKDETRGGAFHKKKESNSKTYNYGGGVKAKMTMKKKKG